MEIIRYEDKCESSLRKFEEWLGEEALISVKGMINRWYEPSPFNCRDLKTVVSELKADYFDVLSFLHKSRCIL